MAKPHLTIIHTSDVHLESDTFGRDEEGQAYRRRIQDAFRKVVDTVCETQADLFPIAGDLFDAIIASA